MRHAGLAGLHHTCYFAGWQVPEGEFYESSAALAAAYANHVFTDSLEFIAIFNIAVLTAGEVSRSSSTEATVKFTSDKACTYHYQLDGTAPATAADLVAAGSNATAMVNSGQQAIQLSSLTDGQHTLYVAADYTKGKVSNLLTITIPDFASPLPSLTAGQISRSSDTAATVAFTSSQVAPIITLCRAMPPTPPTQPQ